MYDWDDKPELNITPLVDVMLVLLAILMVISPNIIYEELINLPKGSAQTEVKEKKKIEILINDAKEIKVNNQTFDYLTFSDNFRLFANDFSPETVVRISADHKLDYGDVMNVMSAVKRSGLTNISLATSG
ncbi:MAG TPA: biopolymer transporter ExbD [Sulfuricurvum sp.]|nr:MAG: biopolymer transporter ExbD [Campylobacterales bacterium 16-40-21]OZA04276.1 MAG: biopolymer transporter ExbD [Sulfuricurvum sp. 17-40-25]HQS66292.1 biopolymer transporter ExbD [Sulfuricurvum sp.]HQT35711.1 biopolymer transporter ExbD [Sulfuricurvum sp.]